MAKVYCAYPYEGDHALVEIGENCPVCGVEAVDRDVPSVNTLSELAAECKGICFMCAMPMTRIHRRQGESKSEARWYHDGHYPCLAQDIWHRFEETWPGYIATGQELNYGL